MPRKKIKSVKGKSFKPIPDVKKTGWENFLKETAGEIREIQSSQKLPDVPGKTGKWGSRYLTKREKALAARIGPALYGHVVELFGFELTARAAVTLEKSKKDRLTRERDKITRKVQKFKKAGFDSEYISRHVETSRKRRPLPDIKQYIPTYKSKNGMWDERTSTGALIRHVRKSTALKLQSRQNYLKKIKSIAEVLEIGITDAKHLYRDTMKEARARLRAVKKTKAYKNLSKRKKARYNQKGWERGALNALWKLLNLDGSP